jgi:hypothetical protein
MRKAIAGLASGALICSFAVVAHGQGKAKGKPFEGSGPPSWAQGVPNNPALSFNRIATFANYRNGAIGDATVSEIVAATEDGNTLVYTDAETGKVGFVDITDPHDPQPLGLSADLGGEPTSVDILGNVFALVGVNTSPSFVAPSGMLAVLDVGTQGIVTTLDLGGQPDSLKISPDRQFAAVVIENERDEDLGDGGLPQSPPGKLVVVDITDPDPAAWQATDVPLVGLAGCYENSDPEPEFVDINDHNQAAVSLQENNCIAIVDLASGTVENSFSAGTVDLDKVDATEAEDVIDQSESLFDIPREPDALTWVPAANGDFNIATANEGDLFGGSRGFSIFDQNGKVLFDSGNELEHIAARIGHYPEGRSANKGTEPEAIEFASFNPDLIFVGSERGSFVAVYELRGQANVVYRQSLPAPLGPEGLLAIPGRNLLVVSGEEDDPTFGVRSTMMIYELQSGQPNYPEILSDNGPNGTPIPWSAMSGLTDVPGSGNQLLAVWDSFYDNSRIFTIDTSTTPARVADALTIVDRSGIGSGNFDPEGIAVAPDGTYWVASEGNANGSRPNRLLQVDRYGNLLQEIGLPPVIEACRAASGITSTLGSGFEGVAVVANGADYTLLVAQQRGWDFDSSPECEALDDVDESLGAAGLNANGQPLFTRLWTYDPNSGWGDPIPWELAPLPADASWVGLSEVTTLDDGSIVVIERDNRTGDWAELKTLVHVGRNDYGDGVSAAEKTVYDILTDMLATNGWVSDKPEGFAVDGTGNAYVITDNDGVDDWSGETQFLRLGDVNSLF